MTNNKEKLVVVSGATGHQGGAVARHLIDAGFTVKGLTRNTSSQASQELTRYGVVMLQCDLDDTAAVRRALNDAWGAFGVFGVAPEGPQQEERQASGFAQQAKASNVQHYVYSSVASAHRSTGIPHFENKWRVENLVRRSGFPTYTILRPAFFMENLTSPWMWPGIENGKLSIALKAETRIQMIAVDDIGAYARMSFEDPQRFNRAEIELAGDELTMPQVADMLGESMGRKIRYERLPIEEIRKNSQDMATMYEWFDRVGLDVDIEGLKKQYGYQPSTFRQWTAKVKWPVTTMR